MPRNRYTTQIRKGERHGLDRQETELAAIARYLQFAEAEPVAEVDPAKAKRSQRFEHKRRHKHGRSNAAQ
jgi:hypothetical protein